MFLKVCLATVLGCMSIANAQTPFCSGGICFIRLDPNSGATWSAAQQRCKENNATLPIADNPDHRMSFLDALSHFQIDTYMGVWLGANASDDGPVNWRWLNGDQYSGTDVQGRGEYYKSYAYVAKKTAEVLTYAAPPNNSYSYICQYISPTPDVCANGTGRTVFVRDNNRCYVKYNEQLSWFSARNRCLENNGDLASFSQLSLLNEIIVDSSGFWVGLRHSHFNWRNGVTGLSLDVTFTSWRIGQPNDASPNCIATDPGDFPNWRDIDCTNSCSYLCQAISAAASAQTMTSTVRPTTSSTLPSTSDSRLLRPSSSTTTTWPTSDLSSPAPQSSNSAEPVQAFTCEYIKHDSSVAIGVGIGIPCAIIILALAITVIILQRENRKLRDRLKYKSGDSKVPESKEQRLNLHTSSLKLAGNAGEGNMQYEELQVQSRLQDQREYEQLGKEQSQYERV